MTQYEFSDYGGIRNRIGAWVIQVSPINPNITVPATPSGLVATPTAKGIQLNWAANSEPDLLEYTLNRHTANLFGPSSAFATARTNAYLDTKVTASNTYYYWLRASNRSGLSSPIHPGSTAGVAAFAQPINTFAEFTTVNCIELFVSVSAAFSIADVTFTTHSGNLVIDGSFRAHVNSHGTGEDIGYKLHVKPHGVNSTATREELTFYSAVIPGSHNQDVRLITTETLSSDTYIFYMTAGRLASGVAAFATNRHLSVNETLES